LKKITQIGGMKCDGKLLLNISKYDDYCRYNDRELHKTEIVGKDGKKYQIYLSTLNPNETIYRGFNNTSIDKFLIPPGSNLDGYRYEPVWYASPEITLIYSCRNSIDNLQKTFPGYKPIDDQFVEAENVSPRTSEAFEKVRDQFKHIMDYNFSSTVGYTPQQPVDLIDVNNISNLKNTLELFNENFSLETYDRLNNLNRITLRKKVRMFQYLKDLVSDTDKNQLIDLSEFTEISPLNQTVEVVKLMEYLDKITNLDKNVKSKILDKCLKQNMEMLKQIIINCFRKVFAFGEYWEYKNVRDGDITV
jgi:hypothetical protein